QNTRLRSQIDVQEQSDRDRYANGKDEPYPGQDEGHCFSHGQIAFCEQRRVDRPRPPVTLTMACPDCLWRRYEELQNHGETCEIPAVLRRNSAVCKGSGSYCRRWQAHLPCVRRRIEGDYAWRASNASLQVPFYKDLGKTAAGSGAESGAAGPGTGSHGVASRI